MIQNVKLSVFVLLLVVWADSTEITDFFTAQNRCDYLVITPATFVEGARELTDYRNRNLKDDVISAQYVVYENLVKKENFKSADTVIRNALAWAVDNWDLKPEYVVLIGDNTVEYSENESVFFNKGPMPTNFTGHIDTLFADDSVFRTDTSIIYNDKWYATESDGKLKFAIGRIPCENNEQLQTYITKLERYESKKNGPWLNRLVMFSDDFYQKNDIDLIYHEDLIKNVSNTLPYCFSDYVYFSDFSERDRRVEDAKSAFFTAVNNGVNWVVFSAHGAPAYITDEKVITADDCSMFNNDSSPVVIFSMSCDNGAYYKKTDSSMCKSYLFSENGGAVAYIATPNVTYFSINANVINGICQQRISNPQWSIGRLMLSGFNMDNGFEIFGDPATNSMPVKTISSRSVYIGNNKISCTINNDGFEKGYCRWQITRKSVNCREPVLYEAEQVVESKAIELTFPESISGDSLVFKCFIWNDSMAGNAGCSFNSSTGVARKKITQNNNLFCSVNVTESGHVKLTFGKQLSASATASFYSISGRLMNKVNIPSGVSSFDYNSRKENTTALSLIVLKGENCVYTYKLVNVH